VLFFGLYDTTLIYAPTLLTRRSASDSTDKLTLTTTQKKPNQADQSTTHWSVIAIDPIKNPASRIAATPFFLSFTSVIG